MNKLIKEALILSFVFTAGCASLKSEDIASTDTRDCVMSYTLACGKEICMDYVRLDNRNNIAKFQPNNVDIVFPEK